MAIIRAISIDKSINEKMEKYCESTDQTVSDLVSMLLNKYLDEENLD